MYKVALEFDESQFCLEINDFFVSDQLKTRSCQSLLLNGDCLQVMKLLPKHSIDLIATDLPYGTTQNKWDIIIPFDLLWEQYNRILKPAGKIVLTAAQPFASLLVMSNPKMFKYDLIWEKTIGSNQFNVKHQPLRTHESILVFYNKKGTYNEQKTDGVPYKINRKINFKGEGYGKQKDNSKINDGFRHARSVVKISNPRIKNGHPTQKPIELMEYIIKSFSNKDDIVLDNCMGFGTTGVASKNLKRNFIGIELNNIYYTEAKSRINA